MPCLAPRIKSAKLAKKDCLARAYASARYIARQFYPRDFQTRTALVPLFHLLDSDSDGRISRIEFLKQAEPGSALSERDVSKLPPPVLLEYWLKTRGEMGSF